ncbi:MAG: ABC transporter permease, partial [Gemmatimonadaceae bacterium]
KSFADVGAYASFNINATLTGAGEPKVYETTSVTGNFFTVLGVQPVAGTLFRDDETWSGGELTAIITHRLWRERFASDPNLAGKTIQLNGRDVRVTGVLPEDFALPGVNADIFRPIAWDPNSKAQASFRRAHFMRPVARLRDGASIEKADAELQTVVSRLQREYPETNTEMGAGITSLQSFLIGESRRPLLVLLGAVALLLLIACANVGNLLLVQASSRSQETALRLALGARASRLVRQALTESFVLASIGGAAGLALGIVVTKSLSLLQPAGLLPSHEIHVSWPVLGYVAAITITSSLLFGIVPVIWSKERVPGDALRARGSSARIKRWGDALLIAEVAIALVLTLGAGLLARSFRNLERTDAGIISDGVLSATVALPGIRYDSISKVMTFWKQLGESALAIPGVTSVGAVSGLSLTQPGWSSDFTARGWTQDREGIGALHRDVLPGYFETMRVPLLSGRYIDDTDRTGGEQVVVINNEVARKFFPNENPVGQEISFNRIISATSNWYRIVGVVGSERQSSLSTPAQPEIFQPATQRGNNSMAFVLRTNGDPRAVIPLLRQAVAQLDPNLALSEVKTMNEVRDTASSRERFLTVLLFSFAVVGFVLALVGVYGVMARVARGRVREMGIRISLGAQASEVRWLVIKRGLSLTIAGVAVGLVVAFASTSVLRSMLYGIQPVDPFTFAFVPLVLTFAAVVACWIPAARASRSNAMQALRSE